MGGDASVFVDTSAFIAVVDRDQPWHSAAGAFFDETVASGSPVLMTSSLVVVESTALLQARFSVEFAIAFHDELLPVIDVRGVDDSLLAEATVAWRAARRRLLSLVDCASFALMRRDDIRVAFTFDRDFQDEGFAVVPSTG
ncbi:MAG: type II toxin-antitoxin system VapC family toxin [Thermoleophilia bacterium]